MTDNQQTVMNEVSEIVRTLAPSAESETALCRLVYDVLTAANVDPQQAALDDVKSLMVVAVRAFRNSHSMQFADTSMQRTNLV